MSRSKNYYTYFSPTSSYSCMRCDTPRMLEDFYLSPWCCIRRPVIVTRTCSREQPANRIYDNWQYCSSAEYYSIVPAAGAQAVVVVQQAQPPAIAVQLQLSRSSSAAATAGAGCRRCRRDQHLQSTVGTQSTQCTQNCS